MRHVAFAMASQVSDLTISIAGNEKTDVRALLFHKDGYRLASGNNTGFLDAVQYYLNHSDAFAYGLVFDGAYEDPLEGAMDCVTEIVVTREGNASVKHTPYIKRGGDITFFEERRAYIDAPYLHLFDPQGTLGSNKTQESFDVLRRQPLKDYPAFFVAGTSQGPAHH